MKFGRNQIIGLAFVVGLLVASGFALWLAPADKLAIWLPWAGDFVFQGLAVVVGSSAVIKTAEAIRGKAP